MLLSSEKTLQPIFSPFIEYEKPQVTIYEGPEGFVTVNEQVIRSFL